MKSFLLVGQSNMAGRGFLSDVTPIYNEKISMLRNGRFQMMAEPINYDREVAGVSLAASFAERFSEEHPTESIGLIPCAEGGSTIEEWRPDGILMRHALAETKFALENSELTAILWHQGESDSLAGHYVDYEEKLIEVLEHFRKELGLPDVPIIIGGLGDYLGQHDFGKSAVEYQQINQKIEQVAANLANCYFVTAKELTANPDGIHLDALSQRRFGLRYYAALQQQASVLTPLTDEMAWITRQSQKALSENEKMYVAIRDFVTGDSPTL